MARTQSAALDRKKLMGDPILVTTIVVLITFLTLFILYPLAILLVDSFVGDGGFSFNVFKRIFQMPTFTHAITNTLKVGFLVGILSTLVGLLFAYVEVYVRMGKFTGGLFKVVSMLPVVSPPFVLSLSMIMLFGKAGIITRFLLKIYDNSVYGFWGTGCIPDKIYYDINKWVDRVSPWIGETNLFLAPFGYRATGEALQHVLNAGFNIYCTVDDHVVNELYDNYALQSRIEIGGYSMTYYRDILNELFFDVDSVLDPDRPPVVYDE